MHSGSWLKVRIDISFLLNCFVRSSYGSITKNYLSGALNAFKQAFNSWKMGSFRMVGIMNVLYIIYILHFAYYGS